MAVLLYLSIYGFRLYLDHKDNPRQISIEFQKKNKAIEKELKRRVDLLCDNFFENPKIESSAGIYFAGEKEEDDGNLLFVYRGDSLIYWNNNKVILPSDFRKFTGRPDFACDLKNGWYEFHGRHKGPHFFLGGYLVKNRFPFQNEFIQNQFSASFNIPASVAISGKIGAYPVYTVDGTYLFSLGFENYQPEEEGLAGVIFLLFFVGSLCWLYFLFRVFSGWAWLRKRNNLFVVFYSTSVILLRIIQGYAGFPAEIYQLALFGPSGYSSSAFLPSLGDFTMNAVVLFVISLVVYLRGNFGPVLDTTRHAGRFAWNMIAMLAMLLLFQAAGNLVTDLVINSSLSLDLQNIFGLTRESGFGLFIIAILLFSLWLISTKVFDGVYLPVRLLKWQVLSALTVAAIWFLICRVTGWNPNVTVTLFFLVYLASAWYFKLSKRNFFAVQHLLFFLCFYAIFATFLLNKANMVKETEKLNLLACKLATQRNPVTEVLYEQVERHMHADSILNQWISPDTGENKPGQDSLAGYLKKQYFKDYWKKYQLQVTFCDPAKTLRIQPQGNLVNCNAYFRGLINNYGKATMLPNLFFLDYGAGKEYYLAIFSLNDFESGPLAEPAIFIEFNLKNADSDPGYPGLLMDKTRMDLPNLSDFSYGLFQNGRLIRAVGTTDYKTDLEQYKEFSASASSFKEGSIVHYQFHINEGDTLLISKKEDNLLSYATPFSYLFILFAVMALVVAGMVHFPVNFNHLPASLRNRLHFSLTGILVVTMLAIGIVQVINIIQINYQKNVDNLRERAGSVVVEVQHQYSPMPDMREVAKSELEDFLVKLSNVFFTDINIYDEKGALISSSRPQIFEEGLLSERMNAMACRKLIAEKNSIFIHHESIGNMHFNSAYLPFYNQHDQLLGFVNLPYFAKQDESKKEISSFLVTFLNVYILLILFGIFITILISNYITAPLGMLALKLSKLRLGMVNEKIGWKQNDEIGQLVSEYNRMVDELSRSADMLARSERENAWREMARQVAHEIKNPLTPMKLSAQYLEKAWNDKAADWDQRLARFTKTLVEQIDALSVIASDFSDFAKMPTVVFTRVDMEEVIGFSLSLYQDATRIRYEFQHDDPECFIVGDRSQLIRLFTNLLNNAVQAIGDHKEGMIRVHLARDQKEVVVKVSDNGCGISPERTGRIFQPDFTTKTSGMGLGLAIVKGIVEGMNGNITFVTEERKGTTFIIKFPSDEEQS